MKSLAGLALLAVPLVTLLGCGNSTDGQPALDASSGDAGVTPDLVTDGPGGIDVPVSEDGPVTDLAGPDAADAVGDLAIADTTPSDMGPTDPAVMLLNPGSCYAFSDDADVPLAIDGVFDATSPVWRRPYDDPPVCPASALLPSTAALVPYVAAGFCNQDTVAHTYDVELIAQPGPDGQPPLDDAFLVLYRGEGVPADARQCLEVNDDIPDSLEPGDSEILGVTVEPGETLTVVATAFTFDPQDGSGTGGYVLVVTNAD